MRKKPFDLDAALNGAKVVTAIGMEVTDIQRASPRYPIHGYPILALVAPTHNWCYFAEDGKAQWDRDNDLFMLTDDNGNYIYDDEHKTI